MTCKDCIHYDKCMDNLYRQFPNYKGREIITDSVCDFFKNKADFVEVVRCKDCKHLTVDNSPTLYAYCDRADLRFEPFGIDTRKHYCGFGEPKNDKG